MNSLDKFGPFPVLYYNFTALEYDVLSSARYSVIESIDLPLTLPGFKNLKKKLVMADISTDFGLLLELGTVMIATQ